MGVVYYLCCACIESFKTAGQLSDVQIGGTEGVARHVAAGHVVEEGVVVQAAFELGLPKVVVRIDEAWGDDLAAAGDDKCGCWGVSCLIRCG